MSGDDQKSSEGKQVSEGGGALTGSEAELGGADAVPDKSTGSATGSGTPANDESDDADS